MTPIYSSNLLNLLETYLVSRDIDKAKKMFVCHREQALEAITQYKPELHKIMERENKHRIERGDYETNKLTRSIQKVTNKTGTFFMFGNNLKFFLDNSPEETEKLTPTFEMFLDYLNDHYFNERMYEARQVAGSETECAKEYIHCQKLDGEGAEVRCRIRSNGKGDTLYSLFDEFGRMVAFAIGYYLRNYKLDPVEHFDVYTAKRLYRFERPTGSLLSRTTWRETEAVRDNPFKKIPIIYYHHEVDWDGAQPRIERLEWVDSKRGDTNEYFGDPYLLVTADVVDKRLADAREVGKVIEMDDKDSRFEFVAPPDCGNMINDEKEDLKESINQDTLTPDWSYKSIMGLGTLSGEAMRRMNLPGYVKRNDLAVRIYNELIRREINLCLAILINYVYIDDSKTADELKRLKIRFIYSDPFEGGIDDNYTEVATLVGAGAMSIRAAVEANHNIIDKDTEYERIMEEKERIAIMEAKASKTANNKSNKEE